MTCPQSASPRVHCPGTRHPSGAAQASALSPVTLLCGSLRVSGCIPAPWLQSRGQGQPSLFLQARVPWQRVQRTRPVPARLSNPGAGASGPRPLPGASPRQQPRLPLADSSSRKLPGPSDECQLQGSGGAWGFPREASEDSVARVTQTKE